MAPIPLSPKRVTGTSPQEVAPCTGGFWGSPAHPGERSSTGQRRDECVRVPCRSRNFPRARDVSRYQTGAPQGWQLGSLIRGELPRVGAGPLHMPTREPLPGFTPVGWGVDLLSQWAQWLQGTVTPFPASAATRGSLSPPPCPQGHRGCRCHARPVVHV